MGVQPSHFYHPSSNTSFTLNSPASPCCNRYHYEKNRCCPTHSLNSGTKSNLLTKFFQQFSNRFLSWCLTRFLLWCLTRFLPWCLVFLAFVNRVCGQMEQAPFGMAIIMPTSILRWDLIMWHVSPYKLPLFPSMMSSTSRCSMHFVSPSDFLFSSSCHTPFPSFNNFFFTFSIPSIPPCYHRHTQILLPHFPL